MARYTAAVLVRATPAQLVAWREAAGGVALSAWIRVALDERAALDSRLRLEAEREES